MSWAALTERCVGGLGFADTNRERGDRTTYAENVAGRVVPKAERVAVELGTDGSRISFFLTNCSTASAGALA